MNQVREQPAARLLSPEKCDGWWPAVLRTCILTWEIIVMADCYNYPELFRVGVAKLTYSNRHAAQNITVSGMSHWNRCSKKKIFFLFLFFDWLFRWPFWEEFNRSLCLGFATRREEQRNLSLMTRSDLIPQCIGTQMMNWQISLFFLFDFIQKLKENSTARCCLTHREDRQEVERHIDKLSQQWVKYFTPYTTTTSHGPLLRNLYWKKRIQIYVYAC